MGFAAFRNAPGATRLTDVPRILSSGHHIDVSIAEPAMYRFRRQDRTPIGVASRDPNSDKTSATTISSISFQRPGIKKYFFIYDIHY
jgi:hypothetical protein